MKLLRVEYFIAGLINASSSDASRPANPLAWASLANSLSIPVQFASRRPTNVPLLIGNPCTFIVVVSVHRDFTPNCKHQC